MISKKNLPITNHKPQTTILGLGSNLGDRLGYLNAAVLELKKILRNIKISPIYESKAVVPEGAAKSWNMDFLNAAIAGETQLNPIELLKAIKVLEKKIGREEQPEKWSPREIDIDILAMDDLVFTEKILEIPHPLLLARPFALWPLADVAPDWRYPLPGPHHKKTARELAEKFVCEHSGTRATDYKL